MSHNKKHSLDSIFDHGKVTAAEFNAMITDADFLSNDGKLTTDDTTDSTSGTTGSIQTDGGIGAALNIATDRTLIGGYYSQNWNSNAAVSSRMVLNADTSAGSLTWNGIGAGTQGQILIILKQNASNSLTLTHNSGSALSADRINTPNNSNIVFTQNGGAVLVYMGSAWQVVAYQN